MDWLLGMASFGALHVILALQIVHLPRMTWVPSASSSSDHSTKVPSPSNFAAWQATSARASRSANPTSPLLRAHPKLTAASLISPSIENEHDANCGTRGLKSLNLGLDKRIINSSPLRRKAFAP